MTWIWTAILIMLSGIARSLLVALLAGEARAHFHALLEGRIRREAAMLPEGDPTDQLDEWLEILDEIRDRPLAAWRFAYGLRGAGATIARDAEWRTMGADLDFSLEYRRVTRVLLWLANVDVRDVVVRQDAGQFAAIGMLTLLGGLFGGFQASLMLGEVGVHRAILPLLGVGIAIVLVALTRTTIAMPLQPRLTSLFGHLGISLVLATASLRGMFWYEIANQSAVDRVEKPGVIANTRELYIYLSSHPFTLTLVMMTTVLMALISFAPILCRRAGGVTLYDRRQEVRRQISTS